MIPLLLTFAASTVFASSALACQPPVNHCYHGDNIGAPEENLAIAPRCWFEVDSKWRCYKELQGSCAGIRDGFPHYDHVTCERGVINPEPSEPEETVDDDDCDTCPPLEKGCYRGNYDSGFVNQVSQYPACWFEEAPGRWGCYEPLDETCSNIKGFDMIDIRECPGASPKIPQPINPTPPKDTKTPDAPSGSAAGKCPNFDNGCYHGNDDFAHETNSAKFPSCWFKENNGRWGCYNPLNGTCSDINGRNMLDIRNCNIPSQPERVVLPGDKPSEGKAIPDIKENEDEECTEDDDEGEEEENDEECLEDEDEDQSIEGDDNPNEVEVSHNGEKNEKERDGELDVEPTKANKKPSGGKDSSNVEKDDEECEEDEDVKPAKGSKKPSGSKATPPTKKDGDDDCDEEKDAEPAKKVKKPSGDKASSNTEDDDEDCEEEEVLKPAKGNKKPSGGKVTPPTKKEDEEDLKPAKGNKRPSGGKVTPPTKKEDEERDEDEEKTNNEVSTTQSPKDSPAPSTEVESDECPSLSKDVCHINSSATDPKEFGADGSPQYWVKIGEYWECSDIKEDLMYKGKVYDLLNLDPECAAHAEEYECS